MYKPDYTISDELLRAIAAIESFRTMVDTSYILPEREIELRYRASVEASHSSTSIEGNPLNLKQVERVLAGGRQLTRHQYAEIEVKNYKKALDFVQKRKSAHAPITLQDILRIHTLVVDQLLPGKKVGVLRKGSIYIADQDNEVQYTGPGADIVAQEVNALLAWLNTADDIHPVIAAAILHFQFVSIHPFSDGNGRTTRLLTSLYLGLRGYDFRGSLVLDSYYSADKLAYYEALSLSDNYVGRTSARLDPWITYFTNGFLSSAKLLSIEVGILSGLTKGVNKTRISQTEADILSYAKQFGSITLSEAEDILRGVPRRTVQRRLAELVDDGYLRTEGNGRAIKYISMN